MVRDIFCSTRKLMIFLSISVLICSSFYQSWYLSSNNNNEDAINPRFIEQETVELPNQDQILGISEFDYSGSWNTIATEKYGYAIPGCSSDVDCDLLPEIWFTTNTDGMLPVIGSQSRLKSLEFNDSTSTFSDVLFNKTYSTTTYAFPFDAFNNGSVDFILKTRNSYPTLDDNYLARWENDDLVQVSDIFNSYSLYDYVSFDFDVDSICDFSMVFEYYANGWQHGEIAKDGSVSSTETSYTKTGSGIFVSDVDGDSEVELVVGSYGGTVTVYDYSGGTFTNAFSVGGNGPAVIYAWDYDLNGIPNIMIVREISGDLTLTSYEFNPISTNYELSSDSLTITGHSSGGLYISDSIDIYGDGNQELVIRSELASTNYELGYITYNNSAFEYNILYTDTYQGKLSHQSVQIDDDPELEFVVSYENTSDSSRIWNKILDYQSPSSPFEYYEQNFDSDVFSGGDILDWDRTDSSITTDTANGHLKIDSTDGLGDWANVTIPNNTKIIEARGRLVSGGLDYKYPGFSLYTATGTRLAAARVLYDSPSSWGWNYEGILHDFRCPFAENVWWDIKFAIGDNNITLFAKSAHSAHWDLISTTDYTGEISYLEIRQDWDALINVDFLKIWYETSGIDTDGDGLSDDYEMIIGTDPNEPDTDKDKFDDGEEDSSGTDPLDRYDNVNITDPILWHEPFNSEIIWDDTNWHRTGTYYTVDESNEWLHKGTAGITDDHAWYDISLTLPIQITFRGRETGSSDAGTAGMDLYLENGTDYGFMGTVYDDWRFFEVWYLDLGYTHVENEWYSVRCNISYGRQELWVKSDSESEWSSLLNTTLKITSEVSGIGFYASLDDHLDIDYVTAARLSIIDTDGDGLSNDDEVLFGTNPADSDSDDDGLSDFEEVLTGTDGFITDPNDADTDSDGLDDGDEQTEGTDPTDNDSDDDSILDGEEVVAGVDGFITDPLDSDTDSDNLSDGYETGTSNTDPTDSDSDDDGLDDQEEVILGVDNFITDPNDADSDNDGLSDGDEMTYSTDPNDDDCDDDTILDGEEVIAGVDGYVTDPNDDDTDSDTLTDAYEIDTSLTDPTLADTDSDGVDDPDELTDGTDPTDSDSDDDGLNDGDEIIANTDPNDSDSDDDGLNDGAEVNTYSTDPLDDDSDNDTILDGEEVTAGADGFITDPNDSDTDDDSILDAEEVTAGADGFITDPNNADTDEDGLTDDFEINTSLTHPNNTDTDSDLMDDQWEYSYGTDPTIPDADDDDDLDGLTNLEEYYASTDPGLSDTDSDGMDDDWEVTNGTDPTINDAGDDDDSDSLSNIEEMNEGTDPQDSDSDDDGLLDGAEVNTHNTDPLDADSDDDTLDDEEEVTLGTDGYITNPNLADSDSDGLSDFEEIGYSTNPNEDDSDNDTILDGEEVIVGTDGYITNPNSGDTDSDGLSDSEEIAIGADGYLTNPTDADSDDDGLNDGDEMTASTNPHDVDSDDDSISDGEEVIVGVDGYITSPTNNDTDSDGLLDAYEIDTSFTDPTDSDTDSDGIDDAEELVTGSDGYITSPTDADSDGDGMEDGYEVTYGLNPTADDSTLDDDLDGLDNLAEFLGATDPFDADTDDDTINDGDELLGIYCPDNPYSNATGYICTNATNSDTDGDGISDFEEVFNGTNNYLTNPLAYDSDGDGLGDYQELNDYSTDPNVIDSDSDGLSDGEEVILGTDGYTTDPNDSDSDNDGLTDGQENTENTDPNDADTDNDGISDGEEVVTGSDGYITNPLLSDTDSDGMPDGWEITNFLNPTSYDDAQDDEDDDGVSNLLEYQNGTNPNDSDSDDDNMPDQWEIYNNFDPTDPTDASQDADDDGLTNLEEYSYGTNPRSVDTDGDGYTDKEEIDMGSDPNEYLDRPTPVTTPDIPIGVILGIVGGIVAIILISSIVSITRRNKRKSRESRIIERPLSTPSDSAPRRLSDLSLTASELTTQRQETFRTIISRYSKIPLSRLTNLLKFRSSEETEKWLLSLPGDLKFFLEGSEVIIPQEELLGKSSTAKDALEKIDESFQEIKTNTCYYCGMPLNTLEVNCQECGKEVLKCAVCKLNISFGDEVGKCSLCEVMAHLDHLQEWVKTQGKCPACLQSLPEEGVVPLSTEGKAKKKSPPKDYDVR